MKNYIRVQQFVCAIFLFSSAQNIKSQAFEKDQTYQKYFQEQERIYQGLVNLKIPGARPLNIDEQLAKSVLENCPEEVKEIISDIEHTLFSSNKKNTIFHGPSGTGKSAIAQAIAIKCQIPCLFFNVGTISTEYKDSGIQNLSKIFKYAQELEKNLGKPCVIIFDELEALTKKHANSHHSENNILVSFWQELDSMKNNNVIAIGTMNNTDDVPDQIINRTSMIEVPLPNLKQTEAVLSYHLNKRENQYNLAYPKWLTAASLAQKTKTFYKKFSNRDLENLVEEATRPVIKTPTPEDGSKKIVPDENFAREIKKIQWQSVEKWQRTFKKHLRDPKITLPLAALTVSLAFLYSQIYNQRENVANHRESIAMQKTHQVENIAMQEKSMVLQKANQAENITMQEKSMAQAQSIADRQMSVKHMSTQSAINNMTAVILGGIVKGYLIGPCFLFL